MIGIRKDKFCIFNFFQQRKTKVNLKKRILFILLGFCLQGITFQQADSAVRSRQRVRHVHRPNRDSQHPSGRTMSVVEHLSAQGERVSAATPLRVGMISLGCAKNLILLINTVI